MRDTLTPEPPGTIAVSRDRSPTSFPPRTTGRVGPCSLFFVNACTSDLIDDLVRPAAPVGIPQALCHHALGEQRMGEPGRQALGAGDWEDRRSDGGMIIPLRQQRPASPKVDLHSLLGAW
jgi:hypothetical protein